MHVVDAVIIIAALVVCVGSWSLVRKVDGVGRRRERRNRSS